MITDSFATSLAGAQVPTPTTRAISSDFETFLRMLTVQLENQDPLNPVESSDYAVQLATFAGVEQQVLTNDLLKGLGAQAGLNGLAAVSGWVGQEVRAAMPARFNGSPLTLHPATAPQAVRAELVVRDLSGTEVRRQALPLGTEPVTWAGTTTDGEPLPNGTYRFEVLSYPAEGEPILSQPQVYARVAEVQFQDGMAMLVLPGGVRVPAADVTALRGG